MIAESCSKKFKKEFDDVIKMIAGGLVDQEARVRY